MFSHISIIIYYRNFNYFKNRVNQDKKIILNNYETSQKTIVFKFKTFNK